MLALSLPAWFMVMLTVPVSSGSALGLSDAKTAAGRAETSISAARTSDNSFFIR